MSSEGAGRGQHLNVSSVKCSTGAMSDSLDQTNSNDGDSYTSDSNSGSVDISGQQHETHVNHTHHQPVRNLHPAVSEDSNVDVESEEQSTPTNNSLQAFVPREMVSNAKSVPIGSEQDEDSEMSDARYIEKQVVESFLNVNSSELQARKGLDISKNIQSFSRNDSGHYKPTNRLDSALSYTEDGYSLPASSYANSTKVEKILDAVKMTIASVAAGEGGAPKFQAADHPNRVREEHMSHQMNQSFANKLKKNKVERSLPASARLPVISSLLAPSSTAYHNKTLPGIQHIASHGKSSNVSRTVLPSVAHFLGPAKSPPMVYTSQKSSSEMCATSLPSTSCDIMASGQPGAHYQTSLAIHTKPKGTTLSSAKSKSSRKLVTPAGLRLSMAASEELPDPLPIPQYSEKVIRAKQMGTVTFDRPTVLRETVQFFLQFKHYWSSHDYDRISNLVIELFPEFKDGSDAHGAPASKRIRTDLSMYARNFRRREVSQRKKDKPSSSLVNPKSESASDDVHESDDKSLLHSPSPLNSSGGPALGSIGNPSDFCNELLTAAGIIESQNMAGANRNGDGNSVIANHRHVRMPEQDSHGHGTVIQKYEAMEEEDRHKGMSSNHRPHEDRLDEAKAETPVHFIYDKDTSRDANTAWQMYSEQMAQAIAAGSYGLDCGVADQAIKKDLGTCARNMRRRFPSAKFKPTSSSQKPWNNLHTGLELQNSEASVGSLVPGTAEYMKALMAAQNMSLTELGMTQRNLGELAVLAGIKQRIEQHPQEVTSLERQYLAQCSGEEQRQALVASAAFGHDTAAVAALSAFYGLGIDIAGPKRGLMSSDYNSTANVDSQSLAAGDSDATNKRQRRYSQAEIENRLQEAEQNHVNLQHREDKLHGISVGVSDKHMVKREPVSPIGDGLKTPSVKHHYQHLSIPSTSTFPSSGGSSSHNPVYWDVHAVSDMAGLGMSHPAPQQTATQAHSQAQIQHLPGHDPSAHPPSAEAPMNLTYNESERHMSHKMTAGSPSLEPLPDSTGLAAQVEVATSSIKSHSPRRRTSSSPRFSHKGDQSLSSRDQMWFPHSAGFKKENQEVVSLPEPLPVPNYSQKIINARDEGSSMRHRSEIIRETARFFLALKYWWSSADYTRISELVVQQFPELKDDSAPDIMTSYRRIQRDLSMCARNLRRSKKPRKMREFTTGPTNTLLDIPKTSHGFKKHTGMLKSSTSFASKLEKRRRKPPVSSINSKKIKQERPAAAMSDLGVSAETSEELTAATALLQQQYMRSTASPYHPSAHLLPSFHLLPSLHTHPALQEQQMQQEQQQQHHQELQENHSHINVEEAHGAKRMVKEESDAHELAEQSHLNGNTLPSSDLEPQGDMSSGGDVSAERSAPTTGDDSHAALRKLGHIKEVTGSVLSEEDHDKVPEHHHHPPTNSMKVYADPDHGCDLQEKFSVLWRKGKFFDASLGVANKKLHVHKLILLAMSPYLQETFKNADPRSQLEVNLPSDTTYETAKAFLKYIYEGVLEVDTSSVRSLHKIATMLQMTKLAQYCQNFAQHLQDEADKVSRVESGEENEAPKISVHLGDPTEIQRQKQIDAQSLQRLREFTGMPSSTLHRTSTNQYMPEEHAQHKGDYLTSGDQAAMDQSGAASNFLHSDLLAQYHAHVAASSSAQSSSQSLMLSSSPQDVAAQQMMQSAQSRHSSLSHPSSSSSSSSSSMYQHHHQHVAAQTKASLLHRLASPDSSAIPSGPTSLDHQQRLALAAYWQAHTLGELMSRGQVSGLTSDPSASELAAIAAAATTSDDTRHMLPNLGHMIKLKGSHPGSHHSKDSSLLCQEGDSSSDHHATMLPETCIPIDMARTQVNSSD